MKTTVSSGVRTTGTCSLSTSCHGWLPRPAVSAVSTTDRSCQYVAAESRVHEPPVSRVGWRQRADKLLTAIRMKPGMEYICNSCPAHARPQSGHFWCTRLQKAVPPGTASGKLTCHLESCMEPCQLIKAHHLSASTPWTGAFTSRCAHNVVPALVC